MIRIIMASIVLFLSSTCYSGVEDNQHSDDYITSIGISAKVLKNIKYSMPKIIGYCVFKDGTWFPSFSFTAEVEQFIPDLVVSVYSRPDSNPYWEVKKIYENKITTSAYKKLREKLSSSIWQIKIPNGEGDTSSFSKAMHGKDEKSRIIDVVGAPLNLIKLPFLSHSPEPKPLVGYYLSQMDGFLDKSEIPELLYTITHPILMISSPIGTEAAPWGTELPRTSRVKNPYRFRASVVAAMHGADIATNKSYGHVAMSSSLSNSCGQNCSIANVVFDKEGKNIKWQEVFPNNRMVTPGAVNDEGNMDEQKGKGNYVFVIWRKYKGCIQAPGKLIKKSKKIEPTEKR